MMLKGLQVVSIEVVLELKLANQNALLEEVLHVDLVYILVCEPAKTNLPDSSRNHVHTINYSSTL
jgi:hypothetical protein